VKYLKRNRHLTRYNRYFIAYARSNRNCRERLGRLFLIIMLGSSSTIRNPYSKPSFCSIQMSRMGCWRCSRLVSRRYPIYIPVQVSPNLTGLLSVSPVSEGKCRDQTPLVTHKSALYSETLTALLNKPLTNKCFAHTHVSPVSDTYGMHTK
jgi:hypothetical protein